jgi:hypothetical protein
MSYLPNAGFARDGNKNHPKMLERGVRSNQEDYEDPDMRQGIVNSLADLGRGAGRCRVVSGDPDDPDLRKGIANSIADAGYGMDIHGVTVTEYEYAMLEELQLDFHSNVVIHPMPRNGHCLYECFSRLFGSVEYLRDCTANYHENKRKADMNIHALLADNEEYPQQYCPGVETIEANFAWMFDSIRCRDQHGDLLQRSVPNRCWGGTWALRAMAALFLKHIICVNIKKGALNYTIYSCEKINGVLHESSQVTNQARLVRNYMWNDNYVVVGLIDNHYMLFDNFNFVRG